MLTLKDKRKLLEDRIYLIGFEIEASKNEDKKLEKILMERTLVLVRENIKREVKELEQIKIGLRNPAI